MKVFFGDYNNTKGKKDFSMSRFAPPPPPGKDINVNFDFTELKDLVYIASGEFANVYSGNWGSKRVAVKILKEEVRPDKEGYGSSASAQLVSPFASYFFRRPAAPGDSIC